MDQASEPGASVSLLPLRSYRSLGLIAQGSQQPAHGDLGAKGESTDRNPAPCSASGKGTSFGITMTFSKDKPNRVCTGGKVCSP